MSELITVTSIKRSKKDKGPPSASKRERHARPPPLIPSLTLVEQSLSSQQKTSATIDVPPEASPLAIVCKLFHQVIEHAGNPTVKNWCVAARDAMENAICDYQEMYNTMTTLQGVNERLHSYINIEHATVVRHKRHLEQSNASLTAECADLRRQLAALISNTNTPAVITPSTPTPTSHGHSNSKGIVISVAPVPLSIVVPSPTSLSPLPLPPTHDTPRYSQHSSNSIGIVKSPSNDALPLLRRTASKDNSSIPMGISMAMTSPPSPVDADSVLRALEAKLAKHIGGIEPTPATPNATIPLSTSPKSSNDITISVTKLTRRHSSNGRNSSVNGIRRSRSSSCDDEVSQSSSASVCSPIASSLSSNNILDISANNLSSVPQTRRGSGGKRNGRSTSPKDKSETLVMDHQLQQVTSLVSTPRSNLTLSINQQRMGVAAKLAAKQQISPSSSSATTTPSSSVSASSSRYHVPSPSSNNATAAADLASLAMLRAVRDDWATQSTHVQRIRCSTY